jgi:hypothetical protein
MYDTARVVSQESNSPAEDENNGNDVQNASHDDCLCLYNQLSDQGKE